MEGDREPIEGEDPEEYPNKNEEEPIGNEDPDEDPIEGEDCNTREFTAFVKPIHIVIN